MPYTVYRSTDQGAPVLSGTAGALIAVLDACLVDGYGSKAPAGWTKPFSASGKAVYRNGASAVARSFWRVIDTGQFAYVRGYDNMSDVDTGTGPFPSLTTVSGNGNPIYKSATSDATAREWICLADERTAVLFNKATPTYWLLSWYAGDGNSDVPGDTNFAVCASHYATTDLNYTTIASFDLAGSGSGLVGESSNYGVFVKGVPGILGAKALRFPAGPNVYGTNWSGSVSQTNIGGDLAMPSGGAIHLWPYYCKTYNGATWEHRGRLRFLYVPRHPTASFGHGDTFSGTGSLSGKRFEAVKLVATNGGSSSTSAGVLVFVTENPD